MMLFINIFSVHLTPSGLAILIEPAFLWEDMGKIPSSLLERLSWTWSNL